MLFRLLNRSFSNQKKAMALMIVSVAVGTALAASLITISLEISGKIAKELRSFGANIIIEPKIEGIADISGQKRYLRSEDIIKAKTIFWRHNIVGLAPFLETNGQLVANGRIEQVEIIGAWYEKELPLPGETVNFPAGIKTVSPWWNIDGKWPDAADKAAIGRALAAKIGVNKGDNIQLDGATFEVSAVIETGGEEDGQIFIDMESLQAIKNMPNMVSKVFVSALTTPMDEFAYKDPKTMSTLEYEKWYCTGYVTSIAKQLEEVFQGSTARPIWQVAQTEGKILDKLKLLIYLLCLTALSASALGVSTTMIMSLLRRTEEIGLMKAMGADSVKIVMIFVSEGALIGLVGGLFGYIMSVVTSKYIGLKVFDAELEQKGLLLPVAIAIAIVISIAGTILPIKRALRIKAAIVLKGAE